MLHIGGCNEIPSSVLYFMCLLLHVFVEASFIYLGFLMSKEYFQKDFQHGKLTIEFRKQNILRPFTIYKLIDLTADHAKEGKN